jgi:hypothetical protein
MPSHNEEFCKDAFGAYLAQILGAGQTTWKNGEDPPDYWLTIDTICYAVEVSTIEEYITFGKKKETIRSARSVYWKLATELEVEAANQGILRGLYFINIERPVPGMDHRLRNRLKRDLLSYIRQTQSEDAHSPLDLSAHSGQAIQIEKLDSEPDIVAYGGMSRVGWPEDPEALDEALQVMQHRVTEKAGILSRFNEPKILLLLNDHHLIEPASYSEMAVRLVSHGFHTIFVVNPFRERQGVLVITSEAHWRAGEYR